MVFIVDKKIHSLNDVLDFMSKGPITFDRVQFDSKSIALVTGGSDGLGLDLVKRLIERNIKVIIVDIKAPASEFKETDGVAFYRCDITDYDQVNELYKNIMFQHGFVTMLFNNAGVTSFSLLELASNDDIRKVIAVNYLGAYNMIETFLPDMIKNGKGYIVNVASVLGIITPARLSSYGASKAGLIALHISMTRYLKLNQANNGIKTLLVTPGKIKTSMFQDVETPSKILAPDIEPSKLAESIITSLEYNFTGSLNAPYYANIVPFFKQLSWPYLRLFKTWCGMNKVTAV